MGIGASRLTRYRDELFVPVTQFTGLSPGPNTDNPIKMVPWGGDGTRFIKQLDTLAIGALLLTTAADAVKHDMPIPPSWDRRQPIGARVVWAHKGPTSPGARTLTWGLSLRVIPYFPTQSLVAGGTLLSPDTAFTAQVPSGTANVAIEMISPRAIFNAGRIPEDSRFMVITITLAAFEGTFTEDKYLCGVLFDFAMRQSIGQGTRKVGLYDPD